MMYDADSDGCLDLFDSDAATPGTDSDSDGFADECDFCPSDASTACAAVVVTRNGADINLYSTADYTSQADYTLTSTDDLGAFNGLAVDPTTGQWYAAAQDFSGTRYLAEVDLSAGTVSFIGAFGDHISSIAFDASGTLYGVTGFNGSTYETLYTIDLATGAITSFVALTTSSDGEALAYCPDDGLLYRASGYSDGNWDLDAIDLSTGAITSVVSGGDTPEVHSMSWDPATSTFLMADIDTQAVSVDTSGTLTTLSASAWGSSDGTKGMVILAP